ncbi:hypothetical protein DXG01_003438 [Tephrocybe rancida]|nr:hypothetical protein DXG01_003438 [Tephrocybe rancida]
MHLESLAKFYDKAWGKVWDSEIFTVTLPQDPGDPVPQQDLEWEYTRFSNIANMTDTLLKPPGTNEDFIVVQDDFRLLLRILESEVANNKKRSSFIVTGQAGIVDIWKGWQKQFGPDLIIMDLPSQLEIAAIVKEAGFDVTQAIAYMNDWGPCTRTILKLLNKPSYEKRHMSYVHQAAKEICNDPDLIHSVNGFGILHSVGSPALFICPLRPTPFSLDDEPSGHGWGDHSSYFPTLRISEIVHRQLATVSM